VKQCNACGNKTAFVYELCETCGSVIASDLEERVEQLESGHRGACHCCEPVGVLNQKLEKQIKQLTFEYDSMLNLTDSLLVSINTAIGSFVAGLEVTQKHNVNKNYRG
jgi:hypothetical protein